MKKMSALKMFSIVTIVFLCVSMLSACKKDSDPTDPSIEASTLSLISDGVKWSDPTYIYAQENGDNPLAFVEYDKGSDSNPVLSKAIDDITEPYQKLVLSIKGQYYIQLNIISKKYEVSSETKQSFKIKLTDEYAYYEFDLADEDYTIFKDLIVRIEIIATPGAKEHFGSFEVNELALDKNDMTVESFKEVTSSSDINSYETTADTFNFNNNWFGSNHILSVLESGVNQKVEYSILPGADIKVSSTVQGELSDFNYVNFRFRGDDGVKLEITVKTTYRESEEILPSVELVLNGQYQNATLYLDELSAQTRDSITEIQIYIEKDRLIPVTGQFEILKAEFSLTPTVDKFVNEISTYSGNQEDFSFNQLWHQENNLTATFDQQDQKVIVTYEKENTTSSIYSQVEGRLSDFSYINIDITTDPYAEFLFQITTRWSSRLDHHMIADENGSIKFTMAFGLHYFDVDIDGIEGFRITPDVNDVSSSGTFTINKAEFSNQADIVYDVTNSIELKDWREVGTIFDIDTQSYDISWSQDDGYQTLYTRIFGNFVQGNTFYYKYIDFTASVSQDVSVQFEVDEAIYELTLTPGQSEYRIILDNPTSGAADTWKFSNGFILYFHINTNQSGLINMSTLSFSNED